MVVADRLLTVTPNALTFGPQTLDVTSGQLVLQVSSIGVLPVTIGTVAVSGTNASEFAVSGNCAGAVLQPTDVCTVSVTFRPTALGARSAVIRINSDAGNDPLTVNVGGSGTNDAVASATLSATGVNFGNTQLNQTSPPRTITVTNTGGAPLVFGANVLGGADAADFGWSATIARCRPSPPATPVRSTWSSRRARSVVDSLTLTFNSNASLANNPVTVLLQGRGVTAQQAPLLGHAALAVLSALLVLAASVHDYAGRGRSPRREIRGKGYDDALSPDSLVRGAVVRGSARWAPPAAAGAQPKPALVQDIDEPGRNPYQQGMSFVASASTCSNNFACSVDFPAVPAGKRLVLTYVSASFCTGQSGQCRRQGRQIPGHRCLLTLPAVTANPAVVGARYTASGPVTFYYEPGDVPRVTLSAQVHNFGSTDSVTVVGYLIPAVNDSV